MGNSSSHTAAETDASMYLNAQERQVLHDNYLYLCRTLNSEPKRGVPIAKLQTSKIIPPFIFRGLLTPDLPLHTASKTSLPDLPTESFDFSHFLRATCRVARSSGAEEVAVYHTMADLNNHSLAQWVGQVVVLGLDAWQRVPRDRHEANMWRQHSSAAESALVQLFLLAPLYNKLAAIDYDPDGEQEKMWRNEANSWMHRATHPGKIDVQRFRAWLIKNTMFRVMLDLALERALFTPLDPSAPLLPYPKPIATQRLATNMLAPRQTGKSQLLTPGDRWALNDALPSDCRQQWDLVFASDLDGKSWNTFVQRLTRSGATLIVIREQGSDYVFGGFASDDWDFKPDFYGHSSNFLFTTRPQLRVFPTSGINHHYQYLNQGTKTLPNGLGMGGQFDYCGLWIDPDFEGGHSCAGPLCSTYSSPQLSKSQQFRIRSVEVWQVRPSPAGSDDEYGGRPKRSAMDAHPDAVALLEMADRKMYASTVRDPDLGTDDDGDLEAKLKRL
ncbi:hypothetical protein H4R34_004300 [Dimargaris verticillata]|uniref:MTOR-associated protein MEAK7 n=1 Tax=Dimargaris verticillata TaxID=2761393 RepID=A0A9W8ECC9_9FUNG|nr:hypothetical protein H4R34_004300 [Dimargaris verticillata]